MITELENHIGMLLGLLDQAYIENNQSPREFVDECKLDNPNDAKWMEAIYQIHLIYFENIELAELLYASHSLKDEVNVLLDAWEEHFLGWVY